MNFVKYKLFKDEILGKDVLDLGIIDHRIDKTQEDDWIHSWVVSDARYTLGLDILENEINELKNRGYDVQVADAQNFRLERKFDVVLAGELIEHLDNHKGFLESVREHLNDGGKFIITTPNSFGLYYWLANLLKGRSTGNPEHTCWFDDRTLAHLLGRFGFQIEKLNYVEVIYDGPDTLLAKNRWLKGLWLMLSRVFPRRFLNTMVLISTYSKQKDE